jgi:nucleotide-binding universal stress UspA family protein
VDGSEASVEALAWAIEEAGRRGATVEAVTVWEDPYTVVGPKPHPSLEGTLLGSVSRGCIQRATVPVVVVPPSAVHRRQHGHRWRRLPVAPARLAG